MNLEDYLQTTIFEPLGMKDTYFNVPADRAGRLTVVYTEDSAASRDPLDEGERTAIDPNYPLVHKRYFSGGAGLTSTAWDYAIFLQMMLNGGRYNGAQILAPRTVQLMTSGQLSFLFNGTDNFGLGFEITSEQLRRAGGEECGDVSPGEGFSGRPIGRIRRRSWSAW